MYEINPNCLLPYSHPDYEAPTADDVSALKRDCSWTGAKIAALVGVDGRTVRRWLGADRPIPYATWRLLCILAGVDESG